MNKMLTTATCLLAIFFAFSSGIVSAQGFVDTQKLTGPKESWNADYRASFYSEKAKLLDEKYKKDPPKEIPTAVAEEFSLSVDEALGIDFLPEKKNFLQKHQYAMLKQKSVLDKLYLANTLNKDSYVEQVATVVEDFFDKAAGVLDDVEFEKLFGMQKHRVYGIFYNLVNAGLSENEKVKDKRMKIK